MSCPNDNATPTGVEPVSDVADTPLDCGGVAEGEEPGDGTAAHNHTTTKSEAMDMTCETAPRYDEEPYMEQVGAVSSGWVWLVVGGCGRYGVSAGQWQVREVTTRKILLMARRERERV